MSETAMSHAELLAHLGRWREWMQTQADGLVELAIGTGQEGGPDWDETLRRWGVTPLSSTERSRHARVGPPRSAGPPPVEVRTVVAALALYVQEQLGEFERAHDPPPEVDRELAGVHAQCRGLAQGMLDRFIGRVRPKITTSSIFANARATAQRRQTAVAGPGVSTLTCTCCGAPRKDGATGRDCEFCGSPL